MNQDNAKNYFPNCLVVFTAVEITHFRRLWLVFYKKRPWSFKNSKV